MGFDLQAIERHLTHHVAHELQNSIGAMSVNLDMLSDDVDDPKLSARIEKLARINHMLQEQVDALRHIIPRGDGQTIPLAISTLVREVGHLFGTLSSQIRLEGGANQALMLGGDVAALFQTLYDGINHCFRTDPMTVVSISVDKDLSEKRVRLHVVASTAGIIGFETVLSISSVPDVSVEIKKTGEGSGFTLIWPLADLRVPS